MSMFDFGIEDFEDDLSAAFEISLEIDPDEYTLQWDPDFKELVVERLSKDDGHVVAIKKFKLVPVE